MNKTEFSRYTLEAGPDLLIFGQKKNGPRFDVQKMTFEYSRASSDGTFDKKKCRDVVVKYDGEKMSPSVFESKIMERKVGRWETAIRVREGNGGACIFSKWFEKKYLSGSAKSLTNEDSDDLEDSAPIVKLFLGKRRTVDIPQDDESDESDEENEDNEEKESNDDKEHSSAHASNSEHTSSLCALDTDAPPSSPPSKKRAVTVRVHVQGVPERFPEYFSRDLRAGLVRDDSGRVVAVRAALPSVSYNVLRDFFAKHTDEEGLAGFEANDSGLHFSAERVRRVRDDPLGRGVIYSFLEDEGRDQAHRRYYLYDASRAEFIKFCGFDENGQYVGFKKKRAHQSPDCFSDEEVLKKYVLIAKQVETVFATSWRAVLEDQGHVRPPDSRAQILDPEAFFVDCPFPEDDILRCAREVFVAAYKSQADLRKTLAPRVMIRSLRRAITEEERERLVEITKWIVFKTNLLCV